jgi:DNA-binding NtrC family response regulator
MAGLLASPAQAAGAPAARSSAAALTGPESSPGRPLKEMVDEAVKAVERQAILDALDRANGSPTKAAALLGISRASVYNKLKEYRIHSWRTT